MSQDHAWLAARFADIRPRAIAALTRQFRDLQLAEDAFAAGCVKALSIWPERGLPDDPFAWLLTVGRNAGRDQLRRLARAGALTAEPVAEEDGEPLIIARIDDAGLRDDVLRLLFICCHPALPTQDQSALALRIVAGLSVEEIAGAFLIKGKAMERRITRAKRAIAHADVPFETPDLAERHRRLKAVSLMLYLLFNEGWSASSGAVQIKTALCEEAIRLARLMLGLFPGVSELMGLLTLFLLQHSRRCARLDGSGQLVALEQQDRWLWDRPMIAEALALLEKALRHGAPGTYQVQAAIAAVHARAERAQDTDWPEIERLYAALFLLEPTPVIRLNHAAAVAKVRGPTAALAMLEAIGPELDDYRWFHAARAGLLQELADYALAKIAYERALALEPTAAECHFIAGKIAECEEKL